MIKGEGRGSKDFTKKVQKVGGSIVHQKKLKFLFWTRYRSWPRFIKRISQKCYL